MNEIEFKMLLNERLCDLAEAILYYYNPCKLQKDSCLVSSEKPFYCCTYTKFDKRGGERVCEFNKDGNCVFRSIGCKLFLCDTAIKRNPECVEALRVVELLAKMYGLTRRPFLGDRYVGRTEERKLRNG